MITQMRLGCQQLVNPAFDRARDLVAWMGAVQAQDYAMVRWALGIRLKAATIRDVEASLARGEILRTHVMRPTWHLVAAEDIRWMLKLSAQRIRSANESLARGRGLEIPQELYMQCTRVLEKVLQGNKNLTRQEVGLELNRAGIAADTHRLTRFLMRAEQDGIVCSGADKNGKFAYALLEERVAPVKELHREEALVRLAAAYFRSHSPAGLQDFVWWSGLPVGDARRAIAALGTALIPERADGRELFVHESCNMRQSSGDALHLLPPYDEYLIAYKNRSPAINPEHHPKAFTINGLFYPVVLYNGRVVGNWSRSFGKRSPHPAISFFERDSGISGVAMQEAGDKYRRFMLHPVGEPITVCCESAGVFLKIG